MRLPELSRFCAKDERGCIRIKKKSAHICVNGALRAANMRAVNNERNE